MAKNAANRFETAGAMAAALRKVLGEPARYVTPSSQQLDEALPVTSAGFWEQVKPSAAGGWLVLGTLALLALVLLVPRGQGGKPRPPLAATASLAVLAPEAVPQGSVPAYLSEGLAGEIISVLQGQGGMRVTPQASSFALSGKSIPVAHDR